MQSYAKCNQTSQHENELHVSMVSILHMRLQPHNTLYIIYMGKIWLHEEDIIYIITLLGEDVLSSKTKNLGKKHFRFSC